MNPPPVRCSEDTSTPVANRPRTKSIPWESAILLLLHHLLPLLLLLAALRVLLRLLLGAVLLLQLSLCARAVALARLASRAAAGGGRQARQAVARRAHGLQG